MYCSFLFKTVPQGHAWNPLIHAIHCTLFYVLCCSLASLILSLLSISYASQAIPDQIIQPILPCWNQHHSPYFLDVPGSTAHTSLLYPARKDIFYWCNQLHRLYFLCLAPQAVLSVPGSTGRAFFLCLVTQAVLLYLDRQAVLSFLPGSTDHYFCTWLHRPYFCTLIHRPYFP